VTDDKRDGDDLFEDLDKFFAPIKDVDWDEPASEGAKETPSEEHVSVHAEEEPEALAPPPAADDDEDDSWYDTSVIDTIEGMDEPDATRDEDADEPIEGAPAEPIPGQEDLFGTPEDDTGFSAGDLDTDTAEWPTLRDEGGSETASDDGSEPAIVLPSFQGYDPPQDAADAPSDEDLEAAAEHFAGSTRDEDAMVGAELIGDEGAGRVERDILSDLEPADSRAVMVASEGLGGPSWQEPASVEVGADFESRRGPNENERDVPAAFLTGVVLAGVSLGALLIGKGFFALIATGVVLVAQGELHGVMVKHHRQPASAVGLITGVLMMAAAYYRGESAVLAMFTLGVVATLLWFMAVPAAHRKDTVVNLALSILNIAWIPLLASYLLIMLNQGSGSDGKALVVVVIGLTFVFDTAAFLGGSVMGGQFFERPLAPTVSPKKSIEGVIIATLVTALISVALVTNFVKPFEDMRIETLVLGLVVAAAATFGDLAESLIKRDLGIKDMGSILPGHGGVLDRIDSLLFVAPAAFLFYRIVFA
jgi:phosphatidate cytidylyltransferase